MLNTRHLAVRLDDPRLLERAVDIGEAAVPVGGKRRGGFACVSGREHGERVMALLARHDGFPNLRLVLSDDDDTMDNVRWGEEEPACPPIEAPDLDWASLDVLLGRYYGYSEKAIHRFVVKQWGRDTAAAAFKQCSTTDGRG